jgi:hypothetical protein
MYHDKSWVTTDMRQNGIDFTHYLQQLRSHKFVLCPEGNSNGHPIPGGGCSSHRFWECIYAGTIPIVTNGKQLSHFSEIPAMVINDWGDLHEDMLHAQYEFMQNREYNLDKLKMSYWKKKIYE